MKLKESGRFSVEKLRKRLLLLLPLAPPKPVMAAEAAIDAFVAATTYAHGSKSFCGAFFKKRPLAFLLLLASCGTLPEPFYGNPGPEGARLATPPAPVLMVPTPSNAMLGDAAPLYAKDLAAALVTFDVPSIAGPATPATWRVTTTARLAGNNVIPAYAVTGPDGKIYGTLDGAPVAAPLWAAGDPAALTAAAQADAPALTKTLTAINAKIQGSDPNSLENRPPRLFVAAVTGAPGDGDTALPLDLARDLPGPDDEVVSDATRADFTVTGKISTQPDQTQLIVELDWTVTDTSHRKIGQVTQIHELAPTDITPYWGDVGAAAAAEAATGIQEVVANAILKKK
jgi:hypothetical protein